MGRAVQYIRALQDTEKANLEKWTMEKIMQERAYSDCQEIMRDYKAKWIAEKKKVEELQEEIASLKAQIAERDEDEGMDTRPAKRPRVEHNN